MPYNSAHVKKNEKNAQNIWSYQKKIVFSLGRLHGAVNNRAKTSK